MTPALPDVAQSAACRIGATRFNEFVTQVARRVDQEKPLIFETLKQFPADLNRWDSQRVKDRRILVH